MQASVPCCKPGYKPAAWQAGQFELNGSQLSTRVIEAAGLGDEPLPPALVEDASALPVMVQEGCCSCVDTDSGCRAAAGASALVKVRALLPAAPADLPDGLPSSCTARWWRR